MGSFDIKELDEVSIIDIIVELELELAEKRFTRFIEERRLISLVNFCNTGKFLLPEQPK